MRKQLYEVITRFLDKMPNPLSRFLSEFLHSFTRMIEREPLRTSEPPSPAEGQAEVKKESDKAAQEPTSAQAQGNEKTDELATVKEEADKIDREAEPQKAAGDEKSAGETVPESTPEEVQGAEKTDDMAGKKKEDGNAGQEPKPAEAQGNEKTDELATVKEEADKIKTQARSDEKSERIRQWDAGDNADPQSQNLRRKR